MRFFSPPENPAFSGRFNMSSGIFRVVAGVSTTLASTASAASVGDVCELDRINNTLLVPIRNGAIDTAVGIVTNTTLTSGQPGLLVFSPSTTGGDSASSWSGGDLPTKTGKDSIYGQPAIFAGLTSGNCVQAGTGGLLTTAASPCGSGGFPNPMTTIGDMIGGGASGAATRVVGGLTGQVMSSSNGATPAFSSPGLPWGNAGAAVTTTPYAPSCDSGTAVLDRDKVVVFQSGASVINMPDPTATGCTGNFVVSLYDDGAGTLTVNRGGTATFNVLNGSTNTDAATSFTLTSGQTAALNANAAGTVWMVKIAAGGSAIINGVTCGTCNLGSLFDTNGNASLLTGTTASAVDQITVVNAAAGGIVAIDATGTDTNIPLSLIAKGTGTINFPSNPVLFGGTTVSTAQSEATAGGNFIFSSGGCLDWTVTGHPDGSQDTKLCRNGVPGLLGLSGSTSSDLQGSLVALGFQNAVANNGTTATVVNKLAISSAGKATVALTSTTHGILGVVMSGAGTTGNAGIVHGGNASLIFDGAITQGDWFITSTTAGGSGHDSGTASTAAPVTSCVGIILAATNATPGSTPQAVWLGCQ